MLVFSANLVRVVRLSLLHKCKTAWDFLEGREGFAAAGRRALRGVGGGWMEKAAADDTFTANEKVELGLPEVVADVSCVGSDVGGVETIAGNNEDSLSDPSMGLPRARASEHDASSGEATAPERLLSSSGEAEAMVAETEIDDNDSRSSRHGNAERQRVQTTGATPERDASAESNDISADESAHGGGTPGGGREKLPEQENSATELFVGEGIADDNEHAASVLVQKRGDKEGKDLESGPEGSAKTYRSSAAWSGQE